MLGCMPFADFSTSVAYLRTHVAYLFGPHTRAADPCGRQKAHFSTFPTQTNTLRHQVMVSVTMHPDHVIGAGFAHAGAGKTRLNTMLLLLIQVRSRLHKSLFY